MSLDKLERPWRELLDLYLLCDRSLGHGLRHRGTVTFSSGTCQLQKVREHFRLTYTRLEQQTSSSSPWERSMDQRFQKIMNKRSWRRWLWLLLVSRISTSLKTWLAMRIASHLWRFGEIRTGVGNVIGFSVATIFQVSFNGFFTWDSEYPIAEACMNPLQVKVTQSESRQLGIEVGSFVVCLTLTWYQSLNTSNLGSLRPIACISKLTHAWIQTPWRTMINSEHVDKSAPWRLPFWSQSRILGVFCKRKCWLAISASSNPEKKMISKIITQP